MPAITPPILPNPSILDRQYLTIQVKKKWTDAWQQVTHMSFGGMDDPVPPEVGHCTLIWHWGDIKPEDAIAFAVTSPQDLTNWFVRIGLVVSSTSLSLVPSTAPIFIGVIQPSEHQLLGDGSVGTGADQEITAYGLVHLLDRVAIHQSWALPFAGDTPIAIDTMLAINEKVGGGYDAGIGNCSSETFDGPYGESAGKSNVFSDDGEVWTLYKWIRYLLVHFPPGGPIHGDIPITLSGLTEALDTITLPRIEQRWKTLKDALDDLICSQRGLGWVTRVSDTYDDETNTVTGTTPLEVYVYSTAATAINVAGAIIPANTEQATFNPGDRDDAGPIVITIDPAAQYEKLVVRGKPILTCFTLSFADGTLRPAWLNGDDTAYHEADAATRASDAMRNVFRQFTVPALWNWSVGNAVGDDVTRNANPGCNNNGVVTELIKGPNRRWGYRFERYLPLPKPASELVQPELSEPIIWFKDPSTPLKWYQADQPPDDSDLPACSLHVSKTGLSFSVVADPAHLIALNHTGDATFDQAPAVDYESMVATMAVRTDVCLEVTNVLLQSFTTTRPGRTKIIDVPDAEAWYVVPGTVIGVGNSSLKRHEGGTMRDDSAKLRTVAAIARAWYGTPRATVKITVNGITMDHPKGSMINAAIGAVNNQAINTVVTRRRIEPTEKWFTTTIETGYADIDLVNLGAINQAMSDDDAGSIQVRSPKTNPMRPPGRYRVKSVANEYLVCRSWDGTTEGDTDVLIARPATLRSTLQSLKSVSSSVTGFTLINSQKVVVTGTLEPETWEVTPSYVVGETEIYPTPVRRDTGVANCSLLAPSEGQAWTRVEDGA